VLNRAMIGGYHRRTRSLFRLFLLAGVITGSARNGYPGRYPLPGYPVRTRVPGNFYYPVAVHSSLPLDCEFGVIDNKSTANLRANCKYNCTSTTQSLIIA